MIEYARQGPTFVSTPAESHNIKTGDPLELKFSFGGIPTPKVSWTRAENKKINGNIETKNLQSTLKFDSITKEDSGSYVFRIHNEGIVFILHVYNIYTIYTNISLIIKPMN